MTAGVGQGARYGRPPGDAAEAVAALRAAAGRGLWQGAAARATGLSPQHRDGAMPPRWWAA